MFERVLSSATGIPPLLYVVVGLLTAWYVRVRVRLPANIPPMPVKPVPVLGHVPMLSKDMLGTLKEWRRTTGDIYSIYMGQTLAVVLNSYDVIKEAFVKNADYFSDRPHRFVDTDERFAGGVVDTSGPVWKEQRAVTISILKQFGMGKNWMGEKINIEVQAYLDNLSKLAGQPTNVRSLTNACVSNIICTIITGNRFELDDPYFQRLFQALAQQMKYLQGTSVLMAFPWLKYLPGDLFHAKALLNNEDLFRREFSLKFINKIRESKDEDMGQNFIQSYLVEEMARRESGKETSLNGLFYVSDVEEQNLTMVITNLFQAGTETTSTTIMWALLFAIHYPKVQEKMHREIDEMIGRERPHADDKTHLKYVNAFIMETQRLGNIAPLSLPHRCPKTTTLRGYTIPEGTIIVPHLHAVHHDAQAWGDPLTLRPERFIDDSGNLAVPENFVPFSLGRRVCLGDALAKLEMFLFITGIFQQFTVSPEDPDNLPSLEPVVGLSCSPQPYKVRFIPRHHEQKE